MAEDEKNVEFVGDIKCKLSCGYKAAVWSSSSRHTHTHRLKHCWMVLFLLCLSRSCVKQTNVCLNANRVVVGGTDVRFFAHPFSDTIIRTWSSVDSDLKQNDQHLTTM